MVSVVKKWLTVRNPQDAVALLLLGFALCLPISVSVAQPFAYCAIVLWFFYYGRSSLREWRSSPFFWPVVVFVVLLLTGALFGPRPEFSIPRSRRLLLLPVIFMMGSVFRLDATDPRRSALAPLALFVAGGTLLGIWDMLRVPVELAAGTALYDTGNMRDPQLYMVSVCMLIAWWIYRPAAIPWPVISVVTAINVVGLVLHFKRGVWIAFALAALLVSGLTRRYQLAVLIILGMVALCFIPQTRERLQLLQEELEQRTGGRRVLWSEVAPGLVQSYPLGAGFRGLEHEDYAAQTTSYIQPGLNHLHNNLIQVTLDAGWLGGVVWLYWMGLTLFLMARAGRRFHRHDRSGATVALACMAAFIGLMLNGLVEYNFGNSIIFMVILFLMGMTQVLQQAAEPLTVTDTASR